MVAVDVAPEVEGGAEQTLIYVGCGGNNNGNLNDWWEYSVADKTWVERASLPGPARHHPFYFHARGIDSDGDRQFAYVGLGHGSTAIAGKRVYKDFYRFDPVDKSWTQVASISGTSMSIRLGARYYQNQIHNM